MLFDLVLVEMFSNVGLFLFAFCNVVYSQNDWSYTEEAYTLEGQPCLTNCINGECYIDWEYTTGKCVRTGVKPPRYRTVKGTYCVSNCGFFGTYYEWCNTDDYYRGWEHCNSRQEYVSTYGRECESPCVMGPNGYYWCQIANSWQYCALPREEIDESEETVPLLSKWNYVMTPQPEVVSSIEETTDKLKENSSIESINQEDTEPNLKEKVASSIETIDVSISPKSMPSSEERAFMDIDNSKNSEEMNHFVEKFNKWDLEPDSNKEITSSSERATEKLLKSKFSEEVKEQLNNIRKLYSKVEDIPEPTPSEQSTVISRIIDKIPDHVSYYDEGDISAPIDEYSY